MTCRFYPDHIPANSANDKKLREYCKKYGLVETGMRSQLIRRLSEFILRYNANLDSESPKSTKKIVDEIVRWERQLNNSRPANILLHNKDKSDASKFDNKAYLSANSQDFKRLIEQARPKKLVPSTKPAPLDPDEVIDLDNDTTTAPKEAGEAMSPESGGEENRVEARQRFFGGVAAATKTNEGDTNDPPPLASDDEAHTSKKARCV